MKFDLIVIGRLKKGPLFELCEEYKTRIQWPLNVIECESKFREPEQVQADEERLILSHLKNDAVVVVLDERGNGMRSLDFAKTLENFQNSGEQYIQFIIGGADGLTDAVRDRAGLMLSFGQQTWPHMMARVMLLEQVYRAQQILKNHPYHRE